MATSTFVYDGDCAFCSACARFIMRRVPTRAAVVAWQFTDLGSLGLTVEGCGEAVRWIGRDASGRRVESAGPVAIADLLRSSTLPWRLLGHLLATRPVLVLARPVYRWVSRHRDRLPGGTPTCALPASQRPTRQPPTGQPPTIPGTSEP